MLSYVEMIEALCARAGSERKASALVGISPTSFNAWCRQRAFPNDEQARHIAELLQLDPAYVLAMIHGERAKSAETRAAWHRIAEVFGKAAALAVMTTTPFLLAPEARAAGFDSNAHWATRRPRRRWETRP